jgi:hypothetical protein
MSLPFREAASYHTTVLDYLSPLGGISIFPRIAFLAHRNQRYDNTILASDASREAASYYTNLFNYLLPPGGIAMIPVVGFVLVEWGFAPSFLIIAILHLLFCIVNAFDQPPLQLQVRAA